MKSVFGTIVVFLGISVILYCNIFSLFAQSWMFTFSLVLAATMLLVAVFVLGLPSKKKGESDDKN